MYPLTPPPLSDKAAFTIPRMLQRWLDVNPATALTRTQAYITLPSFSVISNWIGVSDIVAAFNYEGPNNFSLVGFEIEPIVTPNYLLCVMWKDKLGNTHRYKLWQNVGEVLFINAPLYSGQKIAKNFRFEIWNTDSSPSVQSSTISVYTTVLGGVDYRWGSDFMLVKSDIEVTNFYNINTVPTPPASNPSAAHYERFNPDVGLVSSNSDLVSWTGVNGTIITNGNGTMLVLNDGSISSNTLVVNDLNTGSFTTASYSEVVRTIGFSLYVFDDAGDGVVLDCGNSIIASFDSGTSSLSAFGSSGIPIDVDKYYTIILSLVSATISVFDSQTGLLVGSTTGTPPLAFTSQINFGNINCKTSEMIFYLDDLQGTPDYYNLVNYFTARYYIAFSLPLTFPSNSSPQPN